MEILSQGMIEGQKFALIKDEHGLIYEAVWERKDNFNPTLYDRAIMQIMQNYTTEDIFKYSVARQYRGEGER